MPTEFQIALAELRRESPPLPSKSAGSNTAFAAGLSDAEVRTRRPLLRHDTARGLFRGTAGTRSSMTSPTVRLRHRVLVALVRQHRQRSPSPPSPRRHHHRGSVGRGGTIITGARPRAEAPRPLQLPKRSTSLRASPAQRAFRRQGAPEGHPNGAGDDSDGAHGYADRTSALVAALHKSFPQSHAEPQAWDRSARSDAISISDGDRRRVGVAYASRPKKRPHLPRQRAPRGRLLTPSESASVPLPVPYPAPKGKTLATQRLPSPAKAFCACSRGPPASYERPSVSGPPPFQTVHRRGR
jgi:hypothetical protein